MKLLARLINQVYDALDERWEGTASRRVVARVLIGAFFVSLLAIELHRLGWLPEPLRAYVPLKHYYAIDVAFTLFLIVEVVGLIFGLSHSVADAAGKQVEIFSLILLRQSFKELAAFEEPLKWEVMSEPILRIFADAAGALFIFIAIGFYYSLQRHQRITKNPEELYRFVTAKRVISLALLVIFGGLGMLALYEFALHGRFFPFFDVFYTVLIFSDVLIVLVSLRYSSTYHVVFRNSGFAVATMMIRMALAGPPFWNAALGLAAAVFMIGLSWSYNRFTVIYETAHKAAQAAPPEEALSK